MGQRSGPQAVSKGIATGVTAKVTVRLATDAALAASTYDNGVSGVGATITKTGNGILPDIDGITPVVDDRILVKDQVAGLENGFYIVTSVGSAGTPWILTRSLDADQNAELGVNANAFVSEGTANEDTLFSLTTDGVIDIGTTALVFEAATGVAVPGGADTQVQFNDSGIFAGDSNYVWNNTSKSLGLGVSPTARIHAQLSTSAGANFIAKFEGGGGTVQAVLIRDDGQVSLLNSLNSGVIANAKVVIGGTTNTAIKFGTTANGVGLSVSPTQVQHTVTTTNGSLFQWINTGSAGLNLFPNDASFHTVIASTLRSIDYKLGTSSEANGSGHSFYVRNTANNANLKVFTIKNRATSGDNVDVTFENLANFGIGVTTFGTNAVKVVGIPNGTAPTSSPANMFQMYSADIVAGNAAPHFRTESGDIIKLFKGAALTAVDATATDGTIGTNDNITNNIRTRLNEVESRLQANTLLA